MCKPADEGSQNWLTTYILKMLFQLIGHTETKQILKSVLENVQFF